MTDFYRFRSAEQLLGEYAELERQTIFFAAPEALNDPMEGIQDIVWVGDCVAWTNLFNNYVHYLSYYSTAALASGETPGSDPEAVRHRFHTPTPAALRMAEAALASVLNDTTMLYLINRLADSRRQVRRPELILYIRAIHKQSLEAVRCQHIESGMTSAEAWPYNPAHYKTSPTPIELLDQLSMTTDEIERRLFSQILEEQIVGITPPQVFNPYYDSPWLMAHIPTAYVMELCRMARPNLYIACFTTSFTNTSMWSHYGDRHRGACLIFQSDDSSEGPSITLNQFAEQESRPQTPIMSPEPMLFHRVRYGNKYGEIDFFNAVGNLTTENLRDLLSTDEPGNTSSYAQSRDGLPDEDTRKERDWGSLHPDVTVKTKDWEYEQEHRLVLNHVLRGHGDPTGKASQTMTYDFRFLKGIIFGMEMSDQIKTKIMNVIRRKCIENKNPWFEYRQAYYSPEHGEIRARQFSVATFTP